MRCLRAAFVFGLAAIVTQSSAVAATEDGRTLHPAREQAPFDRRDCRPASHASSNFSSAVAAGLVHTWTSERRVAFVRLLTAADAFGRAVAANEIDTSGDPCQARAAETAERRTFLRTLDDVLTGQNTKSRLLTFGEADDALNSAYRDVMAVGDPQSLAWGSVDKAGIRRTERVWLAYRDAFVAFAATLDQAGAAERVKIELTALRATSLEAFLAD